MSALDSFKKINNGLIDCCLISKNFDFFVTQVEQETKRTKFAKNKQIRLNIIELINKFFTLDFDYLLDLVTIFSDRKFLSLLNSVIDLNKEEKSLIIKKYAINRSAVILKKAFSSKNNMNFCLYSILFHLDTFCFSYFGENDKRRKTINRILNSGFNGDAIMKYNKNNIAKIEDEWIEYNIFETLEHFKNEIDFCMSLMQLAANYLEEEIIWMVSADLESNEEYAKATKKVKEDIIKKHRSLKAMNKITRETEKVLKEKTEEIMNIWLKDNVHNHKMN